MKLCHINRSGPVFLRHMYIYLYQRFTLALYCVNRGYYYTEEIN